MYSISEYILEKLKIDKNTKVRKPLDELYIKGDPMLILCFNNEWGGYDFDFESVTYENINGTIITYKKAVVNYQMDNHLFINDKYFYECQKVGDENKYINVFLYKEAAIEFLEKYITANNKTEDDIINLIKEYFDSSDEFNLYAWPKVEIAKNLLNKYKNS